MLSEWIHVVPNEFGVEGPILVGAYGMGLNALGRLLHLLEPGQRRVQPEARATSGTSPCPNVLGVFPAVSRMVHRGDVEESPETFELNVNPQRAARGRAGLRGTSVELGYDVKSYTSDKVPAAALAVGRVAVDFTEQPEPTEAVDVASHTRCGLIRSLTGQLAWRPGRARPRRPRDDRHARHAGRRRLHPRRGGEPVGREHPDRHALRRRPGHGAGPRRRHRHRRPAAGHHDRPGPQRRAADDRRNPRQGGRRADPGRARPGRRSPSRGTGRRPCTPSTRAGRGPAPRSPSATAPSPSTAPSTGRSTTKSFS